MDVRLRHFLFLTFVHVLILYEINAQTTHDSEGRVCVTSDNRGGVCLQLPQCPRVVSAITRGIRNHTRCGFIGVVELVCCVQEPVSAVTRNPTLKPLTSTVLTPTTPFIEISTRGSPWLPFFAEERAVSTVNPTIITLLRTTSTTVKPRGSHWLPFYAEESAVSTVNPSTIPLVRTASTTVKPRESYVDERENELGERENEREIEDVSLDNGVNEDVEDRFFLGNKNNDKVSPTLFALNTLTGLVNVILGKPPTPRPSPTKLPPLLRPVTKPPTQIYTTPLHILHNERVVTRKPEIYHPITMFHLSSTTRKPILNLQPNEILTYKPKPSQTPTRDPNPISAWPNLHSTHSSGINTERTEYPFIIKPSSLPELSTEKPLVSTHLAVTEKPNSDFTTMQNVLYQLTNSSSESTLIDNVQTLSPVSSTEVEFSTLPVITDLETTATEIPMWSDTQTVPPEVLVIPDVPFVTPIPPENLDLGLGGELPTTEQLGSEPSSEITPVGTKSQEACARYREIPKLTRYIVGGHFAAHGEFPHMAALGFQRPRQTQLSWMCGGTLLNEEYVLTAAHCVITRFGAPVAVRVGYTNLTADASTGLELAVRAAVVHPAYDAASRAHDVALLRLASPVGYSQFAHPACLHAALAPPPGQLLVTGWGSITPDGTTPTDHLKRASVLPVDDSSCRQTYPSIFRSEMICASSDDMDTCKGDSGGPMQYLEDSNSTIYTVVGVTSFGPNPCATGRPGVYSRVASYLPWIEGVAWPN